MTKITITALTAPGALACLYNTAVARDGMQTTQRGVDSHRFLLFEELPELCSGLG